MDYERNKDKHYTFKTYRDTYGDFMRDYDQSDIFKSLIDDYIKSVSDSDEKATPAPVSTPISEDNRTPQQRVNEAIAFLFSLCVMRDYRKNIYEYWWEFDGINYNRALIFKIEVDKNMFFVSNEHIYVKVAKVIGSSSPTAVDTSITEALSTIKFPVNINGFRIATDLNKGHSSFGDMVDSVRREVTRKREYEPYKYNKYSEDGPYYHAIKAVEKPDSEEDGDSFDLFN